MKNLTNIDGTIANALYQNMDKIAACGTDVPKAKQKNSGDGVSSQTKQEWEHSGSRLRLYRL